MTATRREFLKQATLIALAPTVPAFLAEMARGASAAADRRLLVVIQLTGGNDGLNMVIPYADENYYKMRPTLAVRKDQVIRLGDRIGLNPAMPEAVDLFHDGRMSLVQEVGYPNPNKSHEVSMATWQTARFDETEHRTYGWIGSALDATVLSRPSGPHSLLVGDDSPPVALRGRTSVAATVDTLEGMMLSDAALPRLHPAARSLEGGLASFVQRSTLDGLATADRLKAVARQSHDSGALTPPKSELAGRLALVSKLIKSDFGARVYYVAHPGYDTHGFQREVHDRLLRELSQGLKFFLDDLKRSRLEDRVCVLAFSEFGRRVDENASAGTDHGTAAPVLLAGAKLKPGLHGTLSQLPANASVDPVATTDFRQVYQAILTKWLELPAQAALGGRFQELDLF
jgi:uncharacterized protein (DUF1501 family)